jgi:hypothetical protein
MAARNKGEYGREVKEGDMSGTRGPYFSLTNLSKKPRGASGGAPGGAPGGTPEFGGAPSAVMWWLGVLGAILGVGRGSLAERNGDVKKVAKISGLLELELADL